MKNKYIEKVVIVGGGSAGWMTAAALSKHLPKTTTIKLIESSEISTVGVGEATIPAIRSFNADLGIDESEFMRETNATFKLAIRFENWGNIGDAYNHAFGYYGYPINGVSFQNYWRKHNQMGYPSSIHDYNLAYQACLENKFERRQFNASSPDSRYFYAFQFDASLYALYLRKISERRGVYRIDSKVLSVEQDDFSGHIKNIVLANGETIAGDLFIDCTGFNSILMDKTLSIGYQDWSHWLPANGAWAVSASYPKESLEIPPYTRARALTAGWQWRIPLQTRTGDGNVFCEDFISIDNAREQLFENLEGTAISEPKLIRFKTGKRKKMWHKNCVCIGLSSGFLEPLESTSIYLIQATISQLIRNFPDTTFNKANENEFNSLMNYRYTEARNFLILHYHATERNDTEFWRYCKHMSIPEELSHRIELFKKRGFVSGREIDLFSEHSWLAVYFGQGIIPKGFDPRVNNLSTKEISFFLDKMKSDVELALNKMNNHKEALKNYCIND